MPATPATRLLTLERAAQAVASDRNRDYGEPEANFGRIASLWSLWLGRDISAPDVAALLLLVKVARLAHNVSHLDSWVDIAGYAACGAEVAKAL